MYCEVGMRKRRQKRSTVGIITATRGLIFGLVCGRERGGR